MSINKHKVLIILPTNHNQQLNETLKISDLIKIINPLEQGDIIIKLATYRGEKPLFNYEEGTRNNNKDWINQHDELLSSVSNIDNINSDNLDAVIIPSYLYIYQELLINDYNLVKLINSFINKDKIVFTYSHSTYVLSKCYDKSNKDIWPLVGYNICGISLEKSLLYQEEYHIPICEEEICSMGGNYIKNEDSNNNKEIFCYDKGLLTGCDDNCIQIMINCLIYKLNNL